MRRQEVFDRVVRGLASQDWKRSENDEGTCRLRGDHGRKCALGHLIPDKLYTETDEGGLPEEIGALRSAGVTGRGMLNFLGVLMNAHDEPGLGDMRSYFQSIAKSHRLKWPTHV